MKDTKAEILDSAMAIVNARGLSALSVRAVAEDLGLSPGNVSYHYRRKQNLVAALVDRIGQRNTGRLGRDLTDLRGFLELFRDLFRGQLEHRGMLLALPDILETYDEIRASYQAVEHNRRDRLFQLLSRLRDGGSLTATDAELSRLVSHLTLIARFWIAEARVSYGDYDFDRVIDHYLALIADNLRLYVSPAATDELAPYFDGWLAVAE
jgi:AcrR family transcriptional regulator